MRGPNDLAGLSNEEEKVARKLTREIESHFGEGADPYEFIPFSVGAGEFSTRVKTEVIARARKAGWVVTDLDADGGFTVRNE